MRGWPALAAVLFLLLAGCSSIGTSQGTETANFSGIDVPVSQTTGSIKGVVVDATIAPIAKAKVVLALPGGGNKTAATDTQGRFVFSGLAPGTYFLTASAPQFHPTQTSAIVQAGVDPPVTRIQLQPLFSETPYHQAIKQKGFFECSQAGVGLYSSSNCVTDYCPIVSDPATCNGLPTSMLDNVTSQEREWHADVGPGWQAMVFEMTWTPSAQGTSSNMGMTVSTYKPTRDPGHWFASVGGPSPLRFELDVGKEHPTASGVKPTMVPPEGMNRMSYFVSVREPDGSQCVFDCVPPGIAINQEFEVFLTQFYYGIPPANWSFVAGDTYPF